ncbi:Zinc finger protein 3 [Hordeum vulgare]|nr:Zinc finger protein 3 [Hordeum vulgare]
MEAKEEQCELTLHSPSSVREPPGLFLCVYYGRNFYNSQAFGGHQNAHKEERRREMDTARRVHASSLSSFVPSSDDATTARLSTEDRAAAPVAGLSPPSPVPIKERSVFRKNNEVNTLSDHSVIDVTITLDSYLLLRESISAYRAPRLHCATPPRSAAING